MDEKTKKINNEPTPQEIKVAVEDSKIRHEIADWLYNSYFFHKDIYYKHVLPMLTDPNLISTEEIDETP